MLSAIYLRTGLNTSVTILKWEIPLGFLCGTACFIVWLCGECGKLNRQAGRFGRGLLLIAYGAFSVLAYHENEWEVFISELRKWLL